MAIGPTRPLRELAGFYTRPGPSADLEEPTMISEVASREPVELTEEIPHVLRFRGAEVLEPVSRETVQVLGPVDVDRYGLVPMDIRDRRTGQLRTIEVLRLLVVEEDYKPVDKPLNVASRKLIAQLAGDLRSGAYLSYRYTFIPHGSAPRTSYEVHRAPIV